MRQRVLASALLALVVAACGGDGKVTEPQVPPQPKVLAAIGTDPNTGATIETNQDDYLPGEVVHLTGRGWAPNETVHLFMSEEPDTHGDVSQDVQTDSAGAFSLHFYDVQPHDLGVTFTLTATGQTSGAVATAVFTDGNLSVNASNTLPNFAGSRVFSPNGDLSLETALLEASITGNTGNETNVLIDIRVGTAISGASVRTLGPGVDYTATPGGNVSFNRVWDGKDNSSVNVAEGVYTARIYSNQQPLLVSNDVGGSRKAELLIDRTAPVLSAVQVNPSTTTPGASVTFTATATDTWTPITAAEYRVGAGPWLDMTPTAPPFNALSEGLTVAFLAPSAGTYNVCARARDVGLTWSDGTACATLLVQSPNQAPNANAGAATYSGGEGADIALNGSGDDPDGGAVTFAWTVNAPSGVCTFNPANSAITTINCNDNGDWTLTLTVTDDENAVATSTASLKVNNVAPTITGKTAGANADEGSTINFSVTGVDDPSSADETAGFTYAFSCDGGPFGAFGASTSTTCPAGDGPREVTITAKAKDKDGGESEVASSTFTVVNLAPSITAATNNSPVNEGAAAIATMTVTGVSDAWAPDVANPTYAFSCNGGPFGTFGASSTGSCPATDGPATITIAAKVKDKDGAESAPVSQSVTVNNLPPTITSLNAPTSVSEGTNIIFSVQTITDPSPIDAAGPFTYAFSCGATTPTSFSSANNGSCPAADDGTVTVNARVRDKDGGESATFSKSVTVTNAPPVVGAITAPVDPVKVGVSFNVSASFSDAGTLDTHSALWNWGDGTTSAGNVTEANGSGSVSGSHAYTTPGVYTIKVTVTDDDNGSGESIYMYVVAYDPAAGFVTGGGWINSPAGAYVPSPLLSGKANFGFVSKYKKGMIVPDGNTEFQFHAGNLNFKSSDYEWLVVTTFKSLFKGTGTINGVAGYGFLISAIDGQINGGGGVDKFRIKIWELNQDGSEGATVYDNQDGAALDASPTTALGGGSIVIHSGK